MKRPQGVHEEPTGVCKIKKNLSNKAYLGRIFLVGVTQREYKSDLGVRRGVQF
jgi:hypothetical protein